MAASLLTPPVPPLTPYPGTPVSLYPLIAFPARQGRHPAAKVVLDTDVLIDLLRGREAARSFLQEVADRYVPCCSVISVAELYAGMRPEEEAGTQTFLDGLVILPVTHEIAEAAGRFKKRSTSRRLELAVCLISATALVEGATLATGNVKDYPMQEITVLNARR